MNALVLAVGMLLAPGAGSEERAGWHGETMPEGLARGERQGEYRWQRDGSVMVYVPAGRFPMGSDEGDEDERPVHQVWLDGFYVDKYETSWKRWKRSSLPLPRAPDWGIVDEQPVLNVTWADARRYLQWAGKRLPSEAEWEKAARGTDGRQYPWGNETPTFERAVWRDHPTARESTAAVDCCEAGASPYGVLNLAGNVYEWCEDTYDAGYYARSPERNPVNREPGRYRVLRGGAYVLELDDLRSPYRYRLLAEDRTPYIGFRGVVDGTD